MLNKLRLVAFDWDGVIQDSMRDQYKGCVAVFQAAGKQPPSCDHFCRYLTAPFLAWYSELGITQFTGEELIAIFHSATNKEHAPLFSGVKELLSMLQARNIITGIVSHGRIHLINTLIEKYELSNLLQFVECGPDKTLSLSKVCMQYDLAPQQAAFVGDLRSDIRDGKAAGVRTIAFLGSHGDFSVMTEENPDLCVTSHALLARALERA